MSDDTIGVKVWLYGDLKKYGGQAAELAHSRLDLELAAGTRMRDLLAQLGMPLEEKGITFINGDLTDMPGLQACGALRHACLPTGRAQDKQQCRSTIISRKGR